MRSGDLQGKNRQGGLFRTTHKVWNFSAEEEGLKKKSYSKEDSTPDNTVLATSEDPKVNIGA